MRRFISRACALFILTAPLFAADAQAAEPRYWRDGKTVPWVPVAEWEAGEKMMSAVGKDEAAKAPKTAVRYTFQTVNWPTGTIRVYNFTKAGGGVLHAITDETEYFVIEGSVKATVGGKTVVLKAHDVVSHANGVLRSGDVAEDTRIVAWTVGPISTDEPTPTVVRASEATVRGGTNGQTINKRYGFPGNSIRYAQMIAPRKIAPGIGPSDNFHYEISGHSQYSAGGRSVEEFNKSHETYEVHGGDFLFQEQGTYHAWDQKEGLEFVASSTLPKGVTQRMNPKDIK